MILAAWLGFMATGWIVAMLKMFLIIELIAVVVIVIVAWLVARRARRGNAAR